MIASVVSVSGNVFVQRANGEIESVEPGDELNQNDTIVTENGAEVIIEYQDGDQITVAQNTMLALNNEQDPDNDGDPSGSETSEQSAGEVLTLLEQEEGDLLDQFDETAAGTDGGSSSAGNDFIRLSRIVEQVYATPIGFNPITVDEEPTFSGAEQQSNNNNNTADDAGTITVSALVDANDVIQLVGQTTNLIPNSSVTIVLTDANGNQVSVTVQILADGTYSIEVPNDGVLIDGVVTADVSGIDVNGDNVTASDSVILDAVQGDITVDAVVNSSAATLNISGSTQDVAEGATVTLTITDQNGDSITVTATVGADGTYNLNGVDVSTLADGILNIEATAEDNNGNSLTDSDLESLNAVPGEITVTGVVNNNAATMNISGGTEDVAEGATVTLTITDQNGDSITVTATVGADGSYSLNNVDVSTLTDGVLIIEASVEDNNGDPLTDSDLEILNAIQGDITVTGQLDGSSLVINGTTADVEAGGTVNITITDQDGNVITTTATVDADGNYTVNADVSGLSDGPLTVEASATDNNDNPLSADTSVALDLVEGALTVVGELDGSTLTISGTSADLEEGDTVNITITDQDGNVITTTATVGADGNYTIDADVSSLVDGSLTIEATATDNNVNDLSANDSVVLNVVDGALTVAGELDGSTLTVSGTTADLEEGDTVNITITDQDGNVVTTTATVGVDGSYTVDADVSGLVDGALTIEATATDNNGNDLEADTSVTLDIIEGALTVAGEVDGSTLTISGTSADLEEGDTVNITITDQDGNVVTTTATVGADGNYTVDADVSGLVDGSLTIEATGTDNNGNDLDAEAPVTLDLIEGALTVAGELDGSTLTVSGTSADLEEGDTVNITITDQDGNVVTTTATVGADGNYAVDADVSGLVDGALTIEATATDNNGNDLDADTSVTLDLIEGELTVAGELDGSTLTVSGTSADLEEGDTVNITITDQDGNVVTTTATVGADGNYTVDADVSGLVDGSLTIEATAADNNGNDLDANDSVTLDLIEGALTVAGELDGSTLTVSGTTADLEEGDAVNITITDQDGNVVTTTATVGADGNYTVDADVSGLVDGALTIEATATDNNDNDLSANDSVTLDLIEGALTVAGELDGSTLTISGTSVDLEEGDTVNITITDQDGNVVTTTATVGANGNYTVDADVSGLVDGALNIEATATDNNGNDLDANDAVTLDVVAGSLTVAGELDGSTLTISGSTADLEEGDTVNITITDQGGNVVTTTATVGADGNYTVDADVSGLVDGVLNIEATATDNNGNDLDANDSVTLDVITGSLTVAGELDGSTLTISGSTTDLEEGDTVNITITDQDGNVVTTTATVGADGNYTVDADVSGLVDGALTIEATATDNNGNDLDANDSVILDLIEGALTVAGELDGSTLTISGTSADLEEGDTVNITITDQDGNVVTTTATVGANGNYTVDADVSGLVDGALNIEATATDNNGNDLDANDSVTLDLIEGALTVTGELDGSTLTITGTTTDLEEGDIVNITITDQDGNAVTTTATVGADSNYTVDADVSGLVDGSLTIEASATDNNGNDLDANDAVTLDVVAGSLTVAGELDGSTLTISGSTTDLEEGDTVNITITDQDGNAVTTTATVGADGNYTVDADVSGLVDGSLTIEATATDNNGNDLDADTSVTLDLIEGALTVAGELDGSTLTISGSTTDLEEGDTVNITITDQDGNVVTTAATVGANGNYTVDADVSGLVDGSLTIEASATDNNGNDLDANDSVTLDVVTGSLTVTGELDGNNLVISGETTDLEEGDTVNITITDQDGNVVTTTATVGADGNYTVDADVSGLVDGSLTIEATATDNNGNDLDANDAVTLDLVEGALTVAGELDGYTLTVSGTSADLEEGDTVNITITDQDGNVVTTTATVGADGNYTVDADVSGLVDGELSIAATATDNNGNDLDADASVTLDLIEGALTVAGELDGSTLTVSGTTADLEEGDAVNITITDQDGNVVTTTGIVAADGTYTVDADVSGLVDGALTIEATATDNNDNDLSANDSVTLDLIEGALTVAGEVDGSTLTISGTSADLEEGDTVNITITDQDGNVVTTTATVGADGNYTVDADVSGLVDGALTIEATATDNNGNTISDDTSVTLDLIEGALTVAGELDGSTLTVSGTTADLEEGDVVNITITDQDGNVVTTTATVGADGNYTVDADVSGLIDGSLTIEASASDNNGNDLDADSSVTLDLIEGALTVAGELDGSTLTVSGSTIDLEEGDTVNVTITDQDGNVITTTATVGADGNYTVDADVSGLVDGELSIAATATDNNGNDLDADASVTLDLIEGSLTVAGESDGSTLSISGTSADLEEGDTVNITITDQDGNVVTTTATVGADGTYTVDTNVDGLVDGALTIEATATDNNGNDLDADTSVTLDLIEGALTVAGELGGSTLTISGTSADLEEGGTVNITITDQDGNAVTTTATVGADGTYTVDADVSGLVDGALTIEASATDNNGNDLSANDSVTLDLIEGALTVAGELDGSTLTITGTSADLEEGDTVNITITDQDGNVVTTTATVDADGNYTVDADVSGLVDGALTIEASATDNNGNDLDANDSVVLDVITGSLTVTGELDGSTLTITGTSADLEEGDIVNITITDQDGNAVTTTATVDADGNYTIDADVSGLVDGSLNIEATATDNNGNDLDADTSVTLDLIEGALTVAGELDGSTLTVSGTTADLEEGDTVNITITDQDGNVVTTTATVGADGNYTVDADVSGLVDGSLTIEASATDNNGNDLSANDSVVLDVVEGALTVAGELDGSTLTISGTSADIEEGDTVNITVTDQDGNVVTTTATVGADGNYTVDADVSGLVDGSLTIEATGTDNNGNALSDDTSVTLDLIEGALTVAGELDGSTLTISGSTTDLEEGDIVNITITDQDGNAVTTTATVAADGTYTVDAEVDGLVDGPLTIVATASDNNGNDLSANDSVTLDIVDGSLTVSGELDGSTLTISGLTQDLEENDVINITITDQDGNIVTTTATVAADGTYTVDAEVDGLVDGTLTIEATATDNNGNDLEAEGGATLNLIEGDISIDGFVSQGSKQIDIIGSSSDLAPGSEVEITITDSTGVTITLSATIQADGSYSLDNIDISSLTDGDVSVSVEGTDRNGNNVTDTDDITLNLVNGSIKVEGNIDSQGNLDLFGLSKDVGPGEEVTVIITDQFGNSVTVTTTVGANGFYSISNVDLSSLADGSLTLEATATDNNGNIVQGSDAIVLDNLAGAITVNSDVNDTAGTIDINGSTTDIAENSTVTITITDGENTVTATATVDANGNYSVDDVDISSLTDGDITISVSAEDNNGETVEGNTSNELDYVAGGISVNSSIDNTEGTIDINGATTDVAENSIVTITISDGENTVTATATVDAQGNYSIEDVDISGLTDGDITVSVSATDNNGETVTGNASDELDYLAGGISVNSSIDNSEGTININGSTIDVAEGTTVSITITDGENTVTASATVDAQGNYSIDDVDISSLTDGDITVSVSATDNNDETVTGNTNDELDYVAGGISVNSSIDNTEGTIDINGSTTDVAENSTVTITISDGENTVTVTATVDADGNYSVDDVDISSLTDGDITISVSAEDNNGETVTGNTSDELDYLAGGISVNSDVNDTSGTIDINGSTTDIAENSTVTITISDGENTVTATATVDAQGNYSIEGVDISGLTDGDITINVSAEDNNGETVTGNTSDELDYLAGGISVNSSIDNSEGTININGSTTDVAEGATVSITITDGENTVTASATVDADGNYSIEGVDIAGLTDGDITVSVSTTENNGDTVTGNASDELDYLAGDITVNSDVNDTAGTIDINGSTTDVAENSTVTITITDGENTVTATATVDAEGNYSIDDVDVSSLTDGDITINVSAEDNNGDTVDGSTETTLDTTAPGEEANDGNSISFADSPISAVNIDNVSLTGTVEDGATIDSIVITDAEGTEFTVPASAISVDANGNITISGQDLSELADGELTVTMTVTDAAGNQGSIANTTTLVTEPPTISGLNANGDITVSESFLSGGTREGQGQASANGSFNIGAAGSLNVTSITIAATVISMAQLLLLNSANAEPLAVDTDQGTLYITGYDTATGTVSYSFELNQAQQHSSSDNLQLSYDVTVTDNAGQTASAALVVNVTDDEPLSFSPEVAQVEDGFTASLNINGGADGIAEIRFTVTPGEQIFDVDGNAIYFSNASTNGAPLYFDFYVDSQGITHDNILVARSADGTEAFRITINENDGTYTVDIADGVTLYTDDSTSIDSSQFDAISSVIDTGEGDALLMDIDGNDGNQYVFFSGHKHDSGKHYDVTIDSEQGIGVERGGKDNDQEIKAQELIRYDFVTNIRGDEDGIEADSLAITRFRQQINVAKDHAHIAIAIFDDVDDDDIGERGEGHEIELALSNLRIHDSSGADITQQMIDDGNVRIDDGVIEIKHMLDGYSFEIITAEPFEALEVQSIGANGFTLGDFSLSEALSYDEIALQLGLEVVDADGDIATSTLPVGDIDNSNLSVGANADSTLTGSDSDDVILGDRGGNDTVVQPGLNYNVSVMLDVSGSMDYGSGIDGMSRLELAKQSLNTLFSQLADHDGTVNVQLVTFSTYGSEELVINNLTRDNVDDLLNKIDDLYANGGTNYAAAFEQAVEWFNGLSDSQVGGSFENLTYFLTDGEPTYYLDENGRLEGNGSSTTNEVLARSAQQFEFLSQLADVHAIGIGNGVSSANLALFDNTPGELDLRSISWEESVSYWWWTRTYQYEQEFATGEATIVTNGSQLDAALIGGSDVEELGDAGSNVLSGGAGNDVIFANGVNSDHLSWTDGAGNTFNAGEHDGLGLTGLREYLRWEVNNGDSVSDQQLMSYIRTYWEQLASARADGQGGSNIVDGGSGDDLLVGGNADDAVIGGQGNDVMIGGEGSDTFVFDTGDAGTVELPAEDVIKDFTLASESGDKDMLDLSALLDGESAANISDYIVAEDDGQGNTVLYINSQGELSGHDNADQIVTLQDVAMAEGQSSQDFIQQLLSDGQLLIDSGSTASGSQHSSNPLDDDVGLNSQKLD